MPVYTVHEPPRQQTHRDDEARARRRASSSCATASLLGVPARAAVDAVAPAVARFIALLLLVAGVTSRLHAARRRRRPVGSAVALLLALLVGFEAERCGAGSLRAAAWRSRRRGRRRRPAKPPSGASSTRWTGATASRRAARSGTPPPAVAVRRLRPRPTSSACSRSRRRGDDASPSSTTARATCTRPPRPSSARRANAGYDQPIVVTGDPDAVRGADRVVLPGVGAFADCRRGLDAVPGMVEALNETVRRKGRPFLGICVGMQLMAERGREYEVTTGSAGSPARSTASRRTTRR